MNPMNVIAAIASFFFPGLGQLAQGRVKAAIGCFILAVALWLIFLGWIGHLLAAYEAAVFGIPVPGQPPADPPSQ